MTIYKNILLKENSFMKHFVLKLLTLSFIFLFSSAVFADSTLLQTPANYQVIAQKDIPKDFIVPPGTIRVLDFFSYGCPHCAKLAPYLAAWKKSHADWLIINDPAMKSHITQAYIQFQPIPVAFEQGWDIYSKAFYIADALHKSDELNESLFAVAQNPLAGLNSDAQMKSFFLHQGISDAEYNKADDPALLQQKLAEATALLKAFKITEIPIVIVADGTTFYRISNTTVAKADPQTFINTLTLLTQNKPKKEKLCLTSH